MWTSRLRGAAQGLPQPEREDGEDQPGDRRHVEGRAPAQDAGDDPAAREADRNADRGAGSPNRHGASATFFLEVVAKQRGTGRVIARFADTHDGARREELRVTAGQAREQRGQAPDGDANADHGLTHATVGPDPKGDGRHRVYQQEGAPQQPNLAVG